MSPTERALWLRVQRRAATLRPELAAEILKAFRELADQLSETELAAFMRSGIVEPLFSGPLDQVTIERAFAPFRNRLRQGVVRAAEASVRDLPRAAEMTAVQVGFDVLHPNVIVGIRTLETRVLTALTDTVRATVRKVVEEGLREGVGPRTIARRLRGEIGLAPNQVDAITNFRGMLEAGDREALTRVLRDRRYDATLTRALGRAGEGLSERQIDTMTAAYERRMVAFNAETHARTAALDAQKLAQKLTWEQAVARGDVDGGRLKKRWTQIDRPTKRLEHIPLHGEVVPWDQPYSNGQMIPGESDFNCGCLSLFFLARAA